MQEKQGSFKGKKGSKKDLSKKTGAGGTGNRKTVRLPKKRGKILSNVAVDIIKDI